MVIWDLFGALIVTYFISRITLGLAKFVGDGATRLILGHACSWLIIAATLGLLRSNAYYPFAVDAGVIYLVPQAIWFVYDRMRISPVKSSRPHRQGERSIRGAPTSESGRPS